MKFGKSILLFLLFLVLVRMSLPSLALECTPLVFQLYWMLSLKSKMVGKERHHGTEFMWRNFYLRKGNTKRLKGNQNSKDRSSREKREGDGEVGKRVRNREISREAESERQKVSRAHFFKKELVNVQRSTLSGYSWRHTLSVPHEQVSTDALVLTPKNNWAIHPHGLNNYLEIAPSFGNHCCARMTRTCQTF